MQKNTEQDRHQQHSAGILRVEAANDGERDGKGDQAAEDGKEHAVGGQAGALIVICGQLGGQGDVRHIDQREGGVKQHVGKCIIRHQQQLVFQGRAHPEKDKAQRKGQRSKEQEWPPAAPAGARAVGEVSDERIIDVVPGAPDEDSCRCQACRHTDYIGEKNGEINRQNGVGEAERDIACTIDPFDSPG